MVTSRNNIVGMDAAIFNASRCLEKASGHVENFHDPLIDNKLSKKGMKFDHLLEEQSGEVLSTLSKILEIDSKEELITKIVSNLINKQNNSGDIMRESGIIVTN